MLNYLIIGVIVAMIWRNKYEISHTNSHLGTILGSLFGFSLTVIFWPIFAIKMIF